MPTDEELLEQLRVKLGHLYNGYPYRVILNANAVGLAIMFAEEPGLAAEFFQLVGHYLGDVHRLNAAQKRVKRLGRNR